MMTTISVPMPMYMSRPPFRALGWPPAQLPVAGWAKRQPARAGAAAAIGSPEPGWWPGAAAVKFEEETNMGRGLRLLAAVLAAGALAAPAAGAAAGNRDYAQTALNMIPSGELGDVPPPAGADTQALMYDGLTPLFDSVSKSGLSRYFKSERFGVDTSIPSSFEQVPRPGVTIERDSFNVAHVTGATHDDGVWAAGWIAAEDRGLLRSRRNARATARTRSTCSTTGACPTARSTARSRSSRPPR